MNDVRSSFFAEDLTAAVWPAITAVTVPKVEDPAEIHELAARVLQFEEERGIAEPIGILPTIESPRGLRQAHSIAAAHPRVVGLQLGLIDLFLPLGITGNQEQAVHHVRLQLRLAAGEVALPCFDCIFANYANAEGFAADAAATRSLGFSGKSCIHPSQIATANRIFSPTAEEIADARRVVEGARDASREGHGAFVLDGRMIDQPMVRHAEQILRLGASCGRDMDA
jgi:citrate lyase subunit beta/citryl-CoA lyase